jgi:hypothetical protein
MRIRLAFYEGRSFISRLIRLFSRSSVSHVAFWIDESRCIEAWQPFLREEKSLGTAHSKNTTVHIYDIPELTKGQKIRLIDLLNNDLKHQPPIKYAYGHIFLFLPLVRLFIKDKDRDPNNKAFFCSELVSKRLMDVGCTLLNESPYRISPGELMISPKLKRVKTLIT